MATYYIHKRGDGKNTLMITKLYRIVNRYEFFFNFMRV